ncbi:conserved hypothetical protein [Theileria orientalis strain Shintoku]|uniref:Ribosomal RNA-processing protein 43 n=1 Tax=Theileria orientalis strain Shintoku TaxID=869250 RepID=J4DQ72_THEOR|nr:conserved hypothetical protein [Theileria orientalis strain Shintoku]PVC50062.1 hypothetical protein MACL_00002544 [Theileria orientalis]BAM41949.1 conserved hypothetical protein [Theileria orientalis strain Shintoku]|eukprot:XP_009692250.1 conserved hypothetical protein [Theileria orientalis strain Shintoku]
MEDPPLTLSQTSKLASEVYRHVDPLNFYENFLKEGIRPDGRRLCSYRKFTVKNLLESTHNFSSLKSQLQHQPPLDSTKNTQKEWEFNTNLLTCNSKNVLLASIYLNCGNSSYHCKVTGDLISTQVNNWALSLNESERTISVDVIVPKHVVNEIYDLNGPCINISHLVSNLLETVLNSSQVIPKEQFRYYESYIKSQDESSNREEVKKVYSYFKMNHLRWKLNVEIMCDEYDGNLVDMCFLCCSHALMKSKIPFVLLYPNENTFTPVLFNQLDFAKLVGLNKDLLHLQASKFNDSAEDLNTLMRTLVEAGHNAVSFNHIPLTFTFCKSLNYFLLDPTMEDEQTGVNYTIYALKRWNGSNRNASQHESQADVQLQPLNLMGLSEVSEETLNKLYEVVYSILGSLFQ